jgi:N-acetyl-anhydromuramyl-L-alanine amidase AmpD
MREIAALVIHHAAAVTTLEEIDRWHLARGWRGVGYHYVIESDGRLRLGRREHEVGAHARGRNQDTIGICVAVDARDGIPSEAWDQLVTLTRDLVRRYALTVDDVIPHFAVSDTLCPAFPIADLHEAIAPRGMT